MYLVRYYTKVITDALALGLFFTFLACCAAAIVVVNKTHWYLRTIGEIFKRGRIEEGNDQIWRKTQTKLKKLGQFQRN